MNNRFSYRFFLFLVMAFFHQFSFAQIVLNGIAKTKYGEPLVGVNIILNGKLSSASDNSGHFKISISTGQSVCFSMLSYEDTCIQNITSTQNDFTIILKEKPIITQDAVITSRKKDYLIKSAQTGVFEIKLDSLKRMPSITGEADPIKLLQLTPGVAKNELGMGINVRGGSVDQNLVLLDDAVIFNPTHLMGIQSVFNPFIINKLTLIKSGIPAYYGGRLSSITEVETQKEIPEESNVSGNVGILLSNIAIKTPIIKDKLSLYAAGRTSYIDYTVKPVSRLILSGNRSMFQESNFGFYDYNFGIIFKPTQKDRISLSFYNGFDDFKLYKSSFDLNTMMNWSNACLSARWTHSVNSSYLYKTSIGYTRSNFGFEMGQNNFSFLLNSRISDLSVNHEHSIYFGKSNIKIGFQLNNQEVEPNQSKAQLNDLIANFGTPNKFNTYTGSAYIHSEIYLNEKSQLMLGLRGNQYFHAGPYQEFVRKYNLDITDTIVYTKNEIVKSFRNLEPRFSFRYILDNESSLKTSITRNVQFLHLVNVTSVSLPTDFWMPANKRLLPIVGWQYSAGYYKILNNNMLEGSIEIFYKTMKNLAEFSKGILGTTTKESMEENLLLGKGRAYGIEFMLKKNTGKLTGWISYTLSRSERIFAEINNGNPFPSKYDRTHDISIVGQYPINANWKFNAVFIFTTGNAFTLPYGRYIVAGNIINQYADYNSFRMPSYHRLDVAFTRSLKKKGKLEHNLNIGIYNIYSRQNPFYMYYSVSGDLESYKLKIKPKMVSVFPILPSISYEFKF